jgi:TonB family protein
VPLPLGAHGFKIQVLGDRLPYLKAGSQGKRDEMGTNPRTELVGPQAWSANGQTIRLLIALSLLLIALTVVIVKDRDFWFGSDEASESNAGSESTPKSDSAVAPAQAPVARAATAKSYVVPKTSTTSAADSPHKGDASPVSASPVSASPVSANPASPVVATNRVVLPPLDVEVVAGDTHRIVHPGSNVTKVEIPSDSSRRSSVTVAANAAGNERLSSGTVPELRQTVETTYPLLGQHMRVQGSVVLQALVGTDGTIENLRVLSGPAILSAAAQQAVREWHFKPYLQNGQPVETKARITVNFSIRVSDNTNAS